MNGLSPPYYLAHASLFPAAHRKCLSDRDTLNELRTYLTYCHQRIISMYVLGKRTRERGNRESTSQQHRPVVLYKKREMLRSDGFMYKRDIIYYNRSNRPDT